MCVQIKHSSYFPLHGTGVLRIRLCFLYLFHVNPQFTLIWVWLILIASTSTIRMFELIAWYEFSWTVNTFSTLLTNNPWNYMDLEYVLFFLSLNETYQYDLWNQNMFERFLFSHWPGQALNLIRYMTSFDLSGKFNLLLLIYKRLRTGSLRNLHVRQSSWVWTGRTAHTAHTTTDVFNEERIIALPVMWFISYQYHSPINSIWQSVISKLWTNCMPSPYLSQMAWCVRMCCVLQSFISAKLRLEINDTINHRLKWIETNNGPVLID